MNKPSTKDTVLSLLLKNEGHAVSGSEIAAISGVSRNAVWKAVNALKNDGYNIKGVNNNGYTLSPQSDVLSADAILQDIAQKNFISDIIIKKETATTNDDAKLLGHNGAKSGTLVVADMQTNGKGRRGKSFFSPAGSGIYMSLLIRPQAEIEQSLMLTVAASVAVSRAIKKLYQVECSIKWVNDVYINGKKLVGILTEASMNFEVQTLDYAVIGIGINITTQSFPPELCDIVTSLCEHTSKFISRNKLIATVLNELIPIIKADFDKKLFFEEYKERSMVIGKEIDIIYSDRTESATAIDINEDCHLVVKKENGDTVALNSGEVSIKKKKRT